ncbi:hypothetical protein [Symbiopectobacterium sp.]
MVAQVGEPKGSPGYTGIANPAWATTSDSQL